MPTKDQRPNDRRFRAYRAAHRAKAQRLNMPCEICGQPIDYSLTYPDPHAYTLDHYPPLSQGANQYDPTTFRPAHSRCNIQAGNRARDYNHSRQWFK